MLIPTTSDSDLPRDSGRHSFQMAAPRPARSIRPSGDKPLTNFKTSTSSCLRFVHQIFQMQTFS